MADKKPDNVAWDEEKQKYNASILPYATNISGPVIQVDDVGAFKQRGVQRAQKTFTAKYNELKEEWKHLVSEVQLNELIYSAIYSFEPIVGEVYHLYLNKDDKYFLSLIGPKEWNKKFITSVRLNSEHKWVYLNED
jgi:hypothetical protein